jgi:glycosyltransferase involved in cell wall biosynthesis
VAGEGPAAGQLVELANLIGGQVDFIGRQDRAGMHRELAGAAMVVMPSRYNEFSPYSALEAMAAGVPVLASQLGGLPELIGAERCVTPNDQHALAARMRNLWTDPDGRTRDGEALLQRARENHPVERYTRRLLDLYERVRSARY